MSRSIPGIVSAFLVSEIKVSPNVEFDAGFDGEFVRSDAPEYFGLFSGIKAIDVYELGAMFSNQ